MPLDPTAAAALLQYGAMGVLVLILLIASAFGWRIVGSLERVADRFERRIQAIDDNVDKTRHHLSNALIHLEDRIGSDGRPTMPGIGKERY